MRGSDDDAVVFLMFSSFNVIPPIKKQQLAKANHSLLKIAVFSPHLQL